MFIEIGRPFIAVAAPPPQTPRLYEGEPQGSGNGRPRGDCVYGARAACLRRTSLGDGGTMYVGEMHSARHSLMPYTDAQNGYSTVVVDESCCVSIFGWETLYSDSVRHDANGSKQRVEAGGSHGLLMPAPLAREGSDRIAW